MSLKAKLTRLEKRLGSERCPHCGGTLSSDTQEEEVDYTTMTNEERGAIMARAIANMYDREKLLDLLAHLRTSRYAEVDPLPRGEVRPSG
jgi:hypothetical protein